MKIEIRQRAYVTNFTINKTTIICPYTIVCNLSKFDSQTNRVYKTTKDSRFFLFLLLRNRMWCRMRVRFLCIFHLFSNSIIVIRSGFHYWTNVSLSTFSILSSNFCPVAKSRAILSIDIKSDNIERRIHSFETSDHTVNDAFAIYQLVFFVDIIG